MKEYQDIEDWLANACFWIKWEPDRAAVKAELRGHCDDHRDALLAAGMAEGDAGELAVRALGSPDEVGCGLAEVYNTLWSRLWRLSRVFVRVACVVLAYALIAGGMPRFVDLTFLCPWCTRYYDRAADDAWRAGMGDHWYGAYTDWTAGSGGASGDYLGFRWKVCRWARMKTSHEGVEFYQLNAQISARDRLLYAPELHFPYSDPMIYAVDDRGNVYQNFNHINPGAVAYQSNIEANGRLLDRQYFTVRVDNLDERAKWLELRIGIGENPLRLRIDLTEGEAVA